MIKVEITGLKETVAEFEQIDKSQIPYALALSLTRTAQIVQRDERKGLGLHFTIRRRPFMEQGIRIKAATKSNPQAVIRDIDPFMDLQEEGGDKRAHTKYKAFTYKGLVAIPLKGARPNNTSLVKDENYPEAVMRRLGFIRRAKTGTLIMYSLEFKRKAGRRMRGTGLSKGGSWSQTGIKVMYALVPAWSVKKRWGFIQRASDSAQKAWSGEFEKAFQEAVRTADSKFVG